MTTAWEMATTMADKHANSGGIFVRLANNGDKIVGAFCGEPYAREVIWTGERYEQFDENNTAHQGKRPSLRVMLNFYVPAEGAMKVIEGGTVWFKDVLKVRDKYGLDKWLFEIKRHGEAGDPKTTYSILPEEKLDDDLRGQIAGAERYDLAALSSGDANADKGGDKGGDRPSSGGPIDPRDASQLVGRLKQLPRSDVDAFLAEFGVKRVRDLKASDVAKARQALDRLEAAMRAADDEDDSIDPFA
jgi:hypothetical protein